MFKSTLTLAAVSLALLLSPSVSAQSLQYLGPHSGDPADHVNGENGVLNNNDLCSATFDGGQMCESLDMLRSGSPAPPGGGGFQWIKPSIVAVVIDPVDGVRFVDASGISSVASGGLSCKGWNNAQVAVGGLAITIGGSYGVVACSGDLPVACCKVSSGKK